jgi:hypothetical protein
MSFRLFAFEFFLEPAPQFFFFEVSHIKHSPRDREMWFMRRKRPANPS